MEGAEEINLWLREILNKIAATPPPVNLINDEEIRYMCYDIVGHLTETIESVISAIEHTGFEDVNDTQDESLPQPRIS
jgi:hypothetical protein